jgi:protein-tyrosine-phosphatase
VRVLAERGVDIAGNRTKHLRLYTRMRFDRVITLCDKVREVCPDFPGATATAHWSIADPAGEGDSDEATYPAFRRVADELEDRVDLLVAELDVRPPERKSHAR